MNREKTEGTAKDKAGKTQQRAGKAADSSDRHAMGVVPKQSEARMQSASDNVKAAFRNSRHS